MVDYTYVLIDMIVLQYTYYLIKSNCCYQASRLRKETCFNSRPMNENYFPLIIQRGCLVVQWGGESEIYRLAFINDQAQAQCCYYNLEDNNPNNDWQIVTIQILTLQSNLNLLLAFILYHDLLSSTATFYFIVLFVIASFFHIYIVYSKLIVIPSRLIHLKTQTKYTTLDCS